MRSTSRAVAAIGVVAALALAGCSSGSKSDESGDSSSETVTTETLAASDVNTQSRDALQQGGDLRLTITALPSSWNVMSTAGNSVDNNDIYAFVLPITANWIFADDGSYTPNTNYLESYDVQDATADMGQVVTLTLNPAAKWGSGRSITWEDYYYAWKACNGDNADFQCAATDGLSQISDIAQGADQFQVVVTFKGEYPDWANVLAGPNAKEGVSDAETFNNGWSSYNNDWLAGPYIVDSVDEAQQVVNLVANPNWWGDAPLLDTVSFRAMDDSAMGTAFANSEIDVLKGIISADQYTQAATRSDAEIRRAGGLQWRHFTFNSESGVLQDQAVRQALVKGIDREAIAESDLAGIPDLVASELMVGNHFFLPGQSGYQDNSAAYAYDPTKAGSELDALGWTLNESTGYREKDGQTLEFTYSMMPDVSTSKNEGELLQSQMQAIGVKVDFQNFDSSTFLSEDVPAGRFGVTSFTWQGTDFPLGTPAQLYGCGDALAQNGGSNFSRYCDQDLEPLLEQISTTADTQERLDLVNQADTKIWDDVMTVPIYRRIEMTATAKSLANYGAFGLANFKAEDVGFTK